MIHVVHYNSSSEGSNRNKTNDTVTTSSLSTLKKSSYNYGAEKDFSMILKEVQEVAQLPDGVVNKSLGVEMKNIVLSSLQSLKSNDETWKQSWNIIN